jgi:hypothetical protein
MEDFNITKEEIAPGVIVYSNVISNIKNLYQDIEDGLKVANLKWDSAPMRLSSQGKIEYYQRHIKSFIVPYQDGIKNVPTDNSTYKNFSISLGNLFFNSFDPIEKDYMKTYKIKSYSHESYDILKYGSGEKFENHIDDIDLDHRRVSTVYYLNDNYSGGEIHFPRFNITFKPKANQMIVFPSSYVYNHSVSEVSDGIRYSIVSFFK